MNAKKFSEAMSELDSKYISEALNYKAKAKKPGWFKWKAAAACFCMIAAAVTAIPSMRNPQESDGGRNSTSADGGGSGSITDSGQDILEAPPVLFARQNIIDAIERDITSQDIESWAEAENAALDFKCVIPVYSTANVTKYSHSIMETLAFKNEYMIPVIANNECIGTITAVQQENTWVIAVYECGFDLKTEINKHKDTAACLVKAAPLNERGFLITAGTKEKFAAIPGFGISIDMSGEELLNRILDNAGTPDNNADG